MAQPLVKLALWVDRRRTVEENNGWMITLGWSLCPFRWPKRPNLISSTWSSVVNGTAFVFSHISVRKLLAKASTGSLATPTSFRVLGIPGSYNIPGVSWYLSSVPSRPEASSVRDPAPGVTVISAVFSRASFIISKISSHGVCGLMHFLTAIKLLPSTACNLSKLAVLLIELDTIT